MCLRLGCGRMGVVPTTGSMNLVLVMFCMQQSSMVLTVCHVFMP